MGANAAVHAQMTREGVFVYDFLVMFHLQRTLIDAVKSENSLAPVDFIFSPDELIARTKNKKYAVFFLLSVYGIPFIFKRKTSTTNSKFSYCIIRQQQRDRRSGKPNFF